MLITILPIDIEDGGQRISGFWVVKKRTLCLYVWGDCENFIAPYFSQQCSLFGFLNKKSNLE